MSAGLFPAWLTAWLARTDPLVLYAALLTAWNLVLALRFLGHQTRELRLEQENAAFRLVLERLGISADLTRTATGALEITVRPPAER
jgi:hypothetical protein